MQTIIILLRGINVGGKNKLNMAELKAILQTLNFHNIQTYIQSGNVVCQTNETNLTLLSAQLKTAIGTQFEFEPDILMLTKEKLLGSLSNNPYPEAEAEPKTLHLFFLSSPAAQADIGKLTTLKKESERFTLTEEVFYLHTPEGIGRSKLAAQAEKALGVPITARNWRTCLKLKEMAEATN
jgi:uncharacterized protein (DUF1697 family)